VVRAGGSLVHRQVGGGGGEGEVQQQPEADHDGGVGRGQQGDGVGPVPEPVAAAVDRPGETTGEAEIGGLAEYGEILAEVLDTESYPALSAMVHADGFGDAEEWIGDADFTFGLDLLLDGIEVLIARRTPPSPHPDGSASHVPSLLLDVLLDCSMPRVSRRWGRRA
jgi:hypothetical protein